MFSTLKRHGCSAFIAAGLLLACTLPASQAARAQNGLEPHYVSAGDSYAAGTGLHPQKDRSGCGRFVQNPSAIIAADNAWVDDDRSCGGAKIITGFLEPQFDFPETHA